MDVGLGQMCLGLAGGGMAPAPGGGAVEGGVVGGILPALGLGDAGDGSQVSDVLRQGQGAVAGDAGNDLYTVIEGRYLFTQSLKGGVVLRRPPVGGVALAVVLGPVVVKGMADFT